MADKITLLLEAERRGILPPDKAALLSEARKRGLLGGPQPAEQQAESRLVENPAEFGGAGGYNPVMSGLGGAVLDIGGRLGMTPENTESPIRNAFAPAEAAAQFVTGGLSKIPAGLAGIGQVVKNRFSDGMPAADRVRQVEEALTYQPRTGAGAGMSQVATSPLTAYSAGTNYLGEKATDITGSPLVGAAVKTVGDIAPSVVGARGLLKRGPREPARTGSYKAPPPDPIPSTADLTKAAKSAYAKAKDSGVVVPAESYTKALDRIHGVIKDVGINKTLHPKTAALLKQLDKSAGKNLSITEAENIRQVIQEVAGELDPVTRKPTPDAFRASKILDEFDDAVDALSVNSEARALWSRSRKSQLIDDMIHRAEIRAGAHYTQAGMEHALRQEFKQLAMNPRRMRGFTSDQRKAIERVAKGGPVENTLRVLGKFDPTTGGVAAAASAVTSTAFAPVTGGGSFALPVVGYGAKRLATRATARNVEAAREALVGRGLPNAAPRATAPTTQAPAAGASTTVPQATRGAATARAPEAIQADIQQLLEQAQSLPQTPAGSAQMSLIRLKMTILERELAGQAVPQQGVR